MLLGLLLYFIDHICCVLLSHNALRFSGKQKCSEKVNGSCYSEDDFTIMHLNVWIYTYA